MAELAEGTYLIMTAAGSPYEVMDVKGASDKSGTDVRMYHLTWDDGQIWRVTKPDGGDTYQIFCSLTGKVLDVVNGTMAVNTNIRQWDDNNSTAQRWEIEDQYNYYNDPENNGTGEYNGKKYHRYCLRSAKNRNYCASVKNGTLGVDGTSVVLDTYSFGAFASEWIFVPVSTLTETGAYEIVLCADTTMCVEVAGGSAANSANVQVYSRNDTDAQKWHAQLISDETGLYRFVNVKSGKCLDVKGGTAAKGTNVQQYTKNSGDGQEWLPIAYQTVSIDGHSVPTYIIRTQLGDKSLVLDCQSGEKKAKTNIDIWTRNNTIAQRFAFVKTERLASDLTAPGQIIHDLITRSGYGSVSVSGLTFRSNFANFQARYKIRKYKDKRKSYTDTSWMNLADNSTSRSGWGDAWTDTFSASSVDNIVTMPLNINVTLDSTYRSADIYVEVRVFKSNYGTGYAAHGPATQSIIKVAALPEVTLTSADFGTNSEGYFGVYTSFADSFENGCQQLRARLLGEDGNPIGTWVSGVSMTPWFLADRHLFRLPDNGETITIEYAMITDDGLGLQVNGFATHTFSYISEGIEVSISDPDDQKCISVVAEGTSGELSDASCYILVNDASNLKMVKCPVINSENGEFTWRCAPPFNTLTQLFVTGVLDNTRLMSVTDIYIDAHEFMWNWKAHGTNEPLNACASVFINPGEPPQQTRTYKTDIAFSQPAGRRYPVAFSSASLSAQFNIEGVIVDADIKYVSAGPLPKYSTLDYIKKLILLSGQGIHPIYRNPYGDWYQVGIESIDISKLNMGYSKVNVTQRVMEE